jgi:hypothetical protein
MLNGLLERRVGLLAAVFATLLAPSAAAGLLGERVVIERRTEQFGLRHSWDITVGRGVDLAYGNSSFHEFEFTPGGRVSFTVDFPNANRRASGFTEIEGYNGFRFHFPNKKLPVRPLKYGTDITSTGTINFTNPAQAFFTDENTVILDLSGHMFISEGEPGTVALEIIPLPPAVASFGAAVAVLAAWRRGSRLRYRGRRQDGRVAVDD